VTTRAFSDIYDLILPYVPAAETPFVDYHIRRVTREFCRRTTLWRRRVTITTEPGVNDYLLSPYNAADPVAENCDPYSIISVVMDGRELRAVPEDQRVPFGARPLSGTPRAWYSPSARVVHLYPTPDAAHELVVDVVCALTMTPTLPVMPEFLFVDYREIIADGVIASLKMLANKPWYDPEGATIFARRYAFSVQGLRAKLRDGNQPNISTARGPRFGR